jgi:hypothetical protein
MPRPHLTNPTEQHSAASRHRILQLPPLAHDRLDRYPDAPRIVAVLAPELLEARSIDVEPLDIQ